MANIFNNYFCSVFTVAVGSNCILPARTNNKLEKIIFTPERIYHIKPSSSSGPDGISNSLLRNCAAGLSVTLCHIFNFSFNTHKIPLDWRSAYIAPIHKKGSTSDPGNYRPISLTSSCCRAMEQIINKDILNYLQTNNLMSPSQHGFLNSRSTCSNLIERTND